MTEADRRNRLRAQLNAWKTKNATEPGQKFIGKIKRVTIEARRRSASIQANTIDDIRSIVEQLEGNARDQYRVIFYLPIEIDGGTIKKVVTIETMAQIGKINLQVAPTIQFKLAKEAIIELNEHAFAWQSEIFFCFERVTQKLEFGDDVKELEDLNTKPKKGKSAN